MSHANINFKTKKAFKEAVASGTKVGVHNPSGMFPTKNDGTEYVEGPWEYHKWYAAVQMKDGVVVSVK